MNHSIAFIPWNEECLPLNKTSIKSTHEYLKWVDNEIMSKSKKSKKSKKHKNKKKSKSKRIRDLSSPPPQEDFDPSIPGPSSAPEFEGKRHHKSKKKHHKKGKKSKKEKKPPEEEEQYGQEIRKSPPLVEILPVDADAFPRESRIIEKPVLATDSNKPPPTGGDSKKVSPETATNNMTTSPATTGGEVNTTGPDTAVPVSDDKQPENGPVVIKKDSDSDDFDYLEVHHQAPRLSKTTQCRVWAGVGTLLLVLFCLFVFLGYYLSFGMDPPPSLTKTGPKRERQQKTKEGDHEE